jgi:hypothetical protein
MIRGLRGCTESPGDIDELIYGDADTVPSDR